VSVIGTLFGGTQIYEYRKTGQEKRSRAFGKVSDHVIKSVRVMMGFDRSIRKNGAHRKLRDELAFASLEDPPAALRCASFATMNPGNDAARAGGATGRTSIRARWKEPVTRFIYTEA
jgi:hypothetical protein